MRLIYSDGLPVAVGSRPEWADLMVADGMCLGAEGERTDSSLQTVLEVVRNCFEESHCYTDPAN